MFANFKQLIRQLIGKRKIILKIRFGTECLEVKDNENAAYQNLGEVLK